MGPRTENITYSHTSLCTPPLDDRFLTADNLFHQYKPLSAYHYTPYAPNGFLEPAPPPPGYEIAPTYHRPPSRDYTYVDGSTSPGVSGSTDHDRDATTNPAIGDARQTVLMWGAGGTAQEVPIEYSSSRYGVTHPIPITQLKRPNRWTLSSL
ncbi:hypothetical protein EVAR_98519_1 [Eumeta japonica]|uniref:Uncharacterized protein n=1 Tax=Eumeta variegata TaxID=151549 RepID=A0A4C1SUY7_EUMVA|nr:hypothetical protein EVAR_98519_1 [Eumeta japonica]